MKVASILEQLITNLLNLVKDILVPEDARTKKLLLLDPSQMRDLLPTSPVNMKDIFVLFDYQNKTVKTIVKSIKFKNNYNFKKRVAGYLYEEIINLSEDISLFHGSPPIIVPMPMSKSEKRKKGFNQCEELCQEIEKIGNKDLQISFNILKKIRETKRQTTLSRAERLLNVQNSMVVNPNIDIKNRVFIVIDDVYTTLATFYEAKRALTEAGAKRVIGLFIAH